ETPAVIDRAVWTFNTQTFESHRHELPLSMVNATGRVTSTDAARPIDLAASPKRFTADGGHRTCRPEQTLARLNRIVSPITGIVPAVVRLTDHPDMHVYGAIQTDDLPAFRTSAGNRLLGIPDRAMGKGETDVQARVSCLAEAVERYSSRYFPGRTKRRARLAELGGDAVHPDSVLQFSSRQYDSRSAWNARYGGSPNWVPEPFDDATPVDWTAAWSLSRRRTRWLPSAFCFFAYPFEGGPAFAQGDSNGCASGNTIEEAILQGLFELIERDACALWWYNRAKRPEIDLASFGQPFFERMQDRCHDLQRTLHVLDLRTEFDVPVALAVSWRRQDGSNIHFGIGCHLEPRLAASRALAELNQMLLIEGRTNDPATRIAAQFSPGLIDWLENECVADHAYVVPNGMPSIVAQDMHDWSSNDVSDDIRYCVGKLADNGLETIVLDLTRPEIGFPVVRVVVPGLRHFWARLAPGRLYDSPVKLGWLASQTGEDEVNDIPFFM
ncbi:MAG: TOMM precursor leader peptide-binding protein, partial [Hyphomicrobiaceae bacterium]